MIRPGLWKRVTAGLFGLELRTPSLCEETPVPADAEGRTLAADGPVAQQPRDDGEWVETIVDPRDGEPIGLIHHNRELSPEEVKELQRRFIAALPARQMNAPAAQCARCADLEEKLHKARLDAASAARALASPRLAAADRQELSELRAQLAEALTERDDEARINDELRKAISTLRGRVDGLETTLRAFAARPAPPAPTSHDHGGDLITPWAREQP